MAMRTKSKNPLHAALAIAAVLATSGCAATVSLMPEALDAEAKRFTPPPDKANLYLTRTSNLGMAVLFQVHLDGKLAGAVAPGTYLLFDVEPGKHQISVLTQESQATLTINAASGANYFVNVEPKFGWQHARAGLEELTREDGQKAVREAKRAESLNLRP
jgi:Protein of unknown function (DUF2846)